ncbi:stalk domain-containing protein [Paenibacillus aestuarii]|uniref:Stalk domain-containing protein n=1 Tax=Paenibacillus aestuarii TaxID=516965 RepID=A0ABW0K7U6_9BACL
MKLQKKKIITIFALSSVLLVSGALAAYADSTLKQISAYQNAAIKVAVNGNPVDLSSDDGTMYPIVYEGHSYVSAKAVAEALGATVKWNNESQTVEISSSNAASSAVPSKDNTTPSKGVADVLHSKWQGTYSANNVTGATITIDGQLATVDFGPSNKNPNLPTGKYTALVEYNNETKEITLTGIKWINQPSGWTFVDFSGSIYDGSIMTGSVILSSNKSTVGSFTFKLVN